ncbi:MAG: GspE/PulE family protein, partial [Campylobacterota bacterium]|nr:GspE/PulE family protein [Campylobacterota bacterium]
QEVILPLKKTQLYLEVGTTSMDIDLLWMQEIFRLPIKIKLFGKEDILFSLLDIDEKVNLYKLVQNLFEQEKFDNIDVNQFFHDLISLAIKKKSSDVHIETLGDGLVIRFRIDGAMVQILKFGFGLYPIVSSIIKIITNLDISVKRFPQNGRFSQTIDDVDFDFRVSIMPIINGESIVVRILNNSAQNTQLKHLGLDDVCLERITHHIGQNQGLILVTGPTGSGKTTTMYALLKKIKAEHKKIITLEEPVEYKLSGVCQININQDIGLGYAQALKDILRQDPDVIMIGEIRDAQTLQIALQAALTGHLVIATLHTNDAISTIDRLLDLDAMPYLIASTLSLVISQRLVRQLCTKCKINKDNTYHHQGCEHCHLTGFDSRLMISELLLMTPYIQNNIKSGYDAQKIYTHCKQNGFETLHENGMKKVALGQTTLHELKSVCKEHETV